MLSLVPALAAVVSMKMNLEDLSFIAFSAINSGILWFIQAGIAETKAEKSTMSRKLAQACFEIAPLKL